MKKVLVLLTVVAIIAVGCGKAKKAVTAAPEKKAAVEVKSVTPAAVKVATPAAVEAKSVTPVAVTAVTTTAIAK